jgi:hypothetical protein
MIKINKIEKREDVYDIQVPETQCFYANDILVHNCEIFQVTSEDTTAICTLSSMVLKNFIIDGKFDFKLLYDEVRKVTRTLNKVININSYSTDKGRKGGLEQRAIAIGVQGLADVFYLMDYVFTSSEARTLNKQIFETIYFAAITESNQLCIEEKYEPYQFFEGSPMSQGTFQFDMWGLTENDLSGMWDWKSLKESVVKHGVCNSLFTAQMPVACQTSDTKIITEEGVLSFREICEMNKINVDEVESEKTGGVWFNFEKPLSVKTMDGYHLSNKIYYNGHTEIYNIEMEDGAIFKCSSEHKFLVEREGQQIWIKVKDMIDGDDIININE